ncbi:D-alanyl-D-alanine carboxypeptidase/D-alanyl-D-alanine-endopeptidase [Kitasatospora sp. NPDC048540]|uniref:D-alanyl-D-alanine carboxypeptidase/D-alanyl-D-alanine endopeptidase n=1 Tax=Kitasatospora sp. NPDC048540 TaxID=3155634 RepID=UPI0033FADF15
MNAGAGVGRGRRAAVAGVLGAALATSGLTAGTQRALAAPSPPAAAASAKPSAEAPPGSAVLAPVADSADTLPTTQGLQQALAPLLQDKSLGTLNFAISDAATGTFLYGSGENTPATPASTTKLATSVAALSLLPADHRIHTRVVTGAKPDEITLVGGGDPTLTALPADQVQIGGLPVDPDNAPASLTDLAAQTAAALKAAGVTSVKLGYDTSLYTGQLRHMENDDYNVAPVSPLMVDEGKVEPRSLSEAPARVTDPAAQAADAFVAQLKAQGITVQGRPAQATAAADAKPLGDVASPTLARLIERLLTHSDNTIAEGVARQVAIAAQQPASFPGAAGAVTQALAKLGVSTAGLQLNDGSGLSKANLIPPATLVKLLSLAAAPDHPELRPVLTGLPIAGFTGTLLSRFGPRSGAAEASGIVRAKTGTLDFVNTLAGTVVDADGRVLVFAMMTRTPAGADQARAAVDRIVAKLAGCGCH